MSCENPPRGKKIRSQTSAKPLELKPVYNGIKKSNFLNNEKTLHLFFLASSHHLLLFDLRLDETKSIELKLRARYFQKFTTPFLTPLVLYPLLRH